jgi:hypothetical protein
MAKGALYVTIQPVPELCHTSAFFGHWSSPYYLLLLSELMIALLPIIDLFPLIAILKNEGETGESLVVEKIN